jgi:hypothetical protein
MSKIRLNTLGALFIAFLSIIALIGLVYVYVSSKIIPFTFIYTTLTIIAYVNIKKYVFDPIKKNYQIKQVEKQLAKSVEISTNIENTLVLIHDMLEDDLLNPRLNDEEKEVVVGKYISRKESLEHTLSINHKLVNHLRNKKQMEYYERLRSVTRF